MPAHLRPLSNDTMMLLGKKGMNPQSAIFVRIYKEESELEVWKLRDDGRYYHFKTYPICTLVGRAWAPSSARATGRRRKASTPSRASR